MRRDSISPFSLAFLDVMFCGFGAVILFFMIINANTHGRQQQINHLAQAQARELDKAVLTGQKHLAQLNNSRRTLHDELTQTQARAAEIIENTRTDKIQLVRQRAATAAQLQAVEALKADLKSLEEAYKRLEGSATRAQIPGQHRRHFAGPGQRQYLTGLKMGGARILILVDSSASMLADRIVNVLRFRNLSADTRVRAAKWQQVLYTVDWITTRIPPASKFQIYTFNTTSAPVYEVAGKPWLDAGDVRHLNTAVANFYATVPQQGTNLRRAFQSISALSPPPDNIYLLTDGLPTQGEGRSFGTKVTAKARKKLFRQALTALPRGIPVNIILFPMEGDPDAASEYWKLAQRTNGAFFSPARDWP